MSDEFTPTTEQIRSGYSVDPIAEYHDPLANHTLWNERAFDRWLAEYTREKQEAAFDEALRIALGGHPEHVFNVVAQTNPYREKTE